MASFFLAVLLLVLLWWALHQREYLKGNVDRPFFSWGRPQKPAAPPPAEEQRPTYQRKRRQRPAKPSASDINDELQQAIHKITIYTHNRDVSARLLREAFEQNPDQPTQYCVTRVLEKLMRDRRA